MARPNMNPVFSWTGIVAVCLSLVTATGFLVKVSENQASTAETLKEIQAATNENTMWRIRETAKQEAIAELGER